MTNEIILSDGNVGTFLGPLASPYSYKRVLRDRVSECYSAAMRSSNRFFVLEGTIVRAAQSTVTGAMNYMNDSRVLLSVVL